MPKNIKETKKKKKKKNPGINFDLTTESLIEKFLNYFNKV